jgi:hypothetical protein
VCYAQPVTFDDRVRIARDFVQRCGYEVPIAIDRIDNPANEIYAGWPERLYVVDQDGTIAYKGKTGPFGYHPEELAAWLIKRFPPAVLAPSDVSAERIASEPLTMRALEYSGSHERWKLSIDPSGRATLGHERDSKSFDLGADRLLALRSAIAEQDFFAWTEASGEPRVDGRTRSLAITLGDTFKIVHVYSPPEDDSVPAAERSPDVERFDAIWDLLHGIDS